MPAGQAFVIDRGASSCRVGVAETLNSHWSRTSPAEHIREGCPPKISSRFHPPLIAFRGNPDRSARISSSAYLRA
jgi:hypothetical protein